MLEESPSTALDPELRAQMSDAAVAFARAIGYESAGTAEFVLDGRDFYFLELNARIQVEHPVTELVTGVDIVREQLRIARGARACDESHELLGHAVEVRLYAEDPRTFLPQAGTVERLRLPAGIRVDAGVEEGDEIGTSYDPMIAKLIAHGETRARRLRPLAGALRETEVGGVTTNLPFLRWLVSHPLVREGRVTTAFLAEHPPLREPPPLAPGAPWTGAWRLNLPAPPPRAVPVVDDAASRVTRRGREVRARGADARHGDQGARRGGLARERASAAARAGGDEDGDAARRRPTTRRCAPSTSPRATGSPAEQCSSSSTSSGGASGAAPTGARVRSRGAAATCDSIGKVASLL